MPNTNSERNPVEELAEEFLERYRHGERPSLTEYTDKHPELADEIRDLFPALVMMEDVRPGPGEATGAYEGGQVRTADKKPERLGEYRILREVGRGGMGIVYEAEQESLGRHVALKVLPFPGLNDTTYLKRFRREARAAARLHHTNIVPVFGVGESEGVHYYAMQFIQGEGLDKVLQELRKLRAIGPARPAGQGDDNLTISIAQNLLTGSARGTDFQSVLPKPECRTDLKSVPPKTEVDTSTSSARSELVRQSEAEYFRSAARVGMQVAEALEYAHRQGVLHRDIKPSNLLLDTKGVAWVTDFGLAKNAASGGGDAAELDLTHPGDIVGTLRYMAPERFKGWSDPRSDVYSLGITLYELLTLQPAFKDSDRARLIERITHEEPARPRKRDPRIPRDLETIVLKATAKEPGDRYTSAAALAEDLRRFLADRPIQARRARLPERLWRWCRRNPQEAALITSVAVLLLVVAIGSMVAAFWLDHERDRAVDNQIRAERAEEDAGELWKSFLAQLQTSRQGAQAGHRYKSLDLLAKVAAQRPSLELRNEAIWFLTQPDLRIAKQWDGYPPGSRGIFVDAKLERYARGDERGNISIRRMADDTEIMRLPGFGVWAPVVRFSPDGRFLGVKYHRDYELYFAVWDLEQRRITLKVPNGVNHGAFQFSPDSRSVAAGQLDGSFRFYDAASGKETQRWPADQLPFPPYYLAYRPDGRQLAVSSFVSPKQGTPEVRVRDVDTGRVVRALPHPKYVRGVAWHPDGKYLATACDNWHIYVWDVGTGRQVADLTGHRAVPTFLSFSRQGDLLASTGWDGTTRLWNPWTGKLLLTAFGDTELAFSPDDRLLGLGRDGPRLWLWEVTAGRERRVLHGHYAPGTVEVSRASVSPDGRLLASIGEDGIRLWDLLTGKELAHIPEPGTSVIFHPSGKLLIGTGRSGFQLWPIEEVGGTDFQSVRGEDGLENRPTSSGEIRIGPPRTVSLPPVQGHRQADLSRDGRTLVLQAAPAHALVFDIEQGKQKLIGFEHKNLGWVAVSPDGKWLATGTWQWKGVKVWDAQSGQLIKELPVDSTAYVTFSPDGKWLATNTGQEYRFWEVGSWEPGLRIPREGAGDLPGGIVFSADGRMVAAAHSRTLVRLLDASTGQELATLPTSGPPFCFSPDGSLLVTAGENHTIHLWDLRAIRRQLADMNLDWDLPPLPPAKQTGLPEPLKVQVHLEAKGLLKLQ